MSELKTLKDLGIGFEISRYNVVDKNELKVEAAKWVKEFMELDGVTWTQYHFWLDKFNLTEEDLK